MNHDNLLIQYYQQYFILEKNLFQSSLFCEKTKCELLKSQSNKSYIACIKNKNFDEKFVPCITIFLIYKAWKIEYWYPFISKLAFDSKEIGIAKYYIQIAKLEYNMIYMLLNLFK